MLHYNTSSFAWAKLECTPANPAKVQQPPDQLNVSLQVIDSNKIVKSFKWPCRCWWHISKDAMFNYLFLVCCSSTLMRSMHSYDNVVGYQIAESTACQIVVYIWPFVLCFLLMPFQKIYYFIGEKKVVVYMSPEQIVYPFLSKIMTSKYEKDGHVCSSLYTKL